MGVKNPDVIMVNMEKNQEKNIACCWVLAMVEINIPTPRVVNRNKKDKPYNRGHEPTKGILNQIMPKASAMDISRKPIRAKGMIFPKSNAGVVIGVTISCSKVPISLSLTIAIQVSITVIMVKSVATIPGTMK